MAKPPKVPKINKSDLTEALQGLRDDIVEEVHKLSVERDTAQAAESDSQPDVVDAMQMLRTDLRTEIEFLSKLIAKKSDESVAAQNAELHRLGDVVASLQGDGSYESNQPEVSDEIAGLRQDLHSRVGSLAELIEQTTAPPLAPEFDGQDTAESVQELRSEVRTSLSGLSSSIEAIQPSSSLLVFALIAVGGLIVGAASSALYFGSTASDVAEAALARPIEDKFQTLNLAVGGIADRLDSLSSDTSTAASQDSVDQLGTEIAALQTSLKALETTAEDRQKVARQILPETDKTAEQGEASETPKGDGPPATNEQQAQVDVNKPADESGASEASDEPAETEAGSDSSVLIGRIVIKNPTAFDIKLVINGVPVDVKANRTTSVPAHIGRIKTQVMIADSPEYTQYWKDWKVVEGKQQLTINVKSNAQQYWFEG